MNQSKFRIVSNGLVFAIERSYLEGEFFRPWRKHLKWGAAEVTYPGGIEFPKRTTYETLEGARAAKARLEQTENVRPWYPVEETP